MSYKPDGYVSVSPYLIVPDAPAVVSFLEEVFGATRLRWYETADGQLIHGELRIDDSVVMIGQGNEAWPPVPLNAHVYVRDVDAVFARALAAGAAEVQAPKQQEGDPDRRGGVRDAGGNTWWIATQVR